MAHQARAETVAQLRFADAEHVLVRRGRVELDVKVHLDDLEQCLRVLDQHTMRVEPELKSDEEREREEDVARVRLSVDEADAALHEQVFATSVEARGHGLRRAF